MKKTIKVLYLPLNDQPKLVEIANTLEAAQQLVGGYIEVLGIGQTMNIVWHEEGRLLSLPQNPHTKKFIIQSDGRTPEIFGSVFIMGPCDKDGHNTSISKRDAETILRVLSDAA